jgi:DNA topoisomerase-1
MLKLGRKEEGKWTPEELSDFSLEDVKKMIVAQMPDAFEKKAKKSKAAKKSTSKKVATKKAAAKKKS